MAWSIPLEPKSQELVLATIPGDSPGKRLVFASRQDVDKPILLRQESFSPDVGWFVQSTIEMSRREMVLLRSALGGHANSACQSTISKIENDQPATVAFRSLTAAS